MISICGPGEATEEELACAREVGRLIAERGETLVCGGRGGVMRAAAEGAKDGGGTTIGILPDYDSAVANPFIDYAIPTGLGHARNAVVVASGDVVIAIGGGFGTLSEIGLALKMGKPVVHIRSWMLDPDRLERYADGAASYTAAGDALTAVDLAFAGKQTSGGGFG